MYNLISIPSHCLHVCMYTCIFLGFELCKAGILHYIVISRNIEDPHQSEDKMCGSQALTEDRIPEIGACFSDDEDLVDFYKHPPEDLVDFIDCSADMDLPCWLREREGLFKKRQSAQKRKRQTLRRYLGVNI
jgi:hypothetical protein